MNDPKNCHYNINSENKYQDHESEIDSSEESDDTFHEFKYVLRQQLVNWGSELGVNDLCL